VGTGSRLEGTKPRTNEEARLLVQLRRSSPEPAAAASAPLEGCPGRASGLLGSTDTGPGHQIIIAFNAILDYGLP